MPAAELEKFLWEAISFGVFLAVCGGLLKRRYSPAATLLAGAAWVGCVLLAQGALLWSGREATLVLTLLPLTAYLPTAAVVHLLSARGFFPTAAVWTVGAMACTFLRLVRKLLLWGLNRVDWLSGGRWEQAATLSLLLAAAVLVFLILRFLRKPFLGPLLEGNPGWLPLCFPVLMVFLFLSYFASSTTRPVLLVLSAVTALSVLLAAARQLAAAAQLAELREVERQAALQLQRQRQEYEAVRARLEEGRAYRHDLRYHLTVLEGMARQGNLEGVCAYLSQLDGRLARTSGEHYCANFPVDAVLSSYLGRAKASGCQVQVQAALPSQLPFDELDVCALLANALENAVEACEKLPAPQRRLRLSVQLLEGGQLKLLVANPCPVPLAFDGEGFPQVPHREGHGLGLRSIRAVAQKYQGLFRCQCREGEFLLQAVLFPPPPAAPAAPAKPAAPHGRKGRRAVPLLLAGAACGLVLFYLFPAAGGRVRSPSLELPTAAQSASARLAWGDTAFAMELPEALASPAESTASAQGAASAQEPLETAQESPAAGQPAGGGHVDLPGSLSWESGGQPSGSWTGSAGGGSGSSGSGGSGASGEETDPSPPQEDSSEEPLPDGDLAAEDLTQQVDSYLQQMRETFQRYVARKYDGYVGMDITHQVLRDDGRLLTVRFDATLNVGGSGQYSRYFTLDWQAGKVLELADLFQPGSSYVQAVSGEVLRQMTQQVAAGMGDYFIPGGIWPPEECFQQIDPDQNFYINSTGQLVVAFEEYEVAPGSMGAPEFTIPTQALQGLLRQPSLLS